jgi:hypothetical protein
VVTDGDGEMMMAQLACQEVDVSMFSPSTSICD